MKKYPNKKKNRKIF